MLTFAESKHPIFRSTSPLSRGVLKSKGGVKLSIHFCADGETVETVFRTIISVNRLSIYGAVSDLCEECNTCHDRTGRLVVAGQSSPLFVPSVMMTHIPLTDDPAQEEDLLQRYQERIEKLSQHTEWLNFVLMQDSWPQLKSDSTSWQKTLKNSHNLQSQWLVVSTLCQEMKTYLNQKVGFEGTLRLDPVLEITTCCVQGKYGVEIRIKSVNKDHSHSWVRISHGLNKLITNLNKKVQDDNEQETSGMQFEVFALKSKARAFASR